MEKGGETPYARLELRDQLYLEARAMAEYALANGRKVPASAVKTVDAFAGAGGKGDQTGPTCGAASALPIEDLVKAHFTLVKILEPAKPSTILLLDLEQKKSGFWKFLGPVPLIRQMMAAAFISLVFFIGIGLFNDVRPEAGKILLSSGLPLLLNLSFYLAAAGLGASFAALYKANSYIAKGTFDPTYHASYWTRFFLGIIAGLVLSVMISDNAFKSAAGESAMLEEGIIRPLLAMLGGFSADLVYTILNRLVETFESLFKGSTSTLVAARTLDAQAQVESYQTEQQLKLASELMKLREVIGADSRPEEIKEKLSRLLGDLLPATDPSAGD